MLKMVILSKAVKNMGSMSIQDIGKGLLALAGSLFAITLSLKFMPKNMLGIGLGLILVSTALVILSKALKNMGGMSIEDIGKGLLALSGSLFAITLSLKFMPKNVFGIGLGLILVSTALIILSEVLKSMGSMDIQDIGKGLLTLTVSLFAISVALKNMPKNMIRVGVGLIAVSARESLAQNL